MMLDEIAKRAKLKEKVLREAKEFAEIIVETVRESLVVLDSDLKVLSANKSFYETFHVDPKTTVDQYIYDLGNGQWNIPRLRVLLEEILPKKNSFENYEIDHDFETIGKKTMLLNARRLDDLQLILLAIEDISKSKEENVKRTLAEEAMEISEGRYRSLFNASRDAIMTIEPPTWKFTSGNPATIAMFGMKNVQEFLSYEPWELSPEFQPDGKKSIDKAKEMIEKAMHEGSNNFEWVHKRKNGKEFFAEVALVRVEDGSAFLQAVVRDITERKKSEKVVEEKLRLTASNTMFQQVIEAIPVRIFWKDKNLLYLGCNTLFARDAGKTHPSELIGKSDYEMGWKNEADMYRGDDKAVILSKKPKINYEEPQTTPQGNQIWLRTSKIPLRDQEGTIIGILGTYEDITERKQTEEKYRMLIEHLHDGIFIIQDEKLQFVNEAFATIAGYSIGEIIGRKFQDFIAPSYKEVVLERYRQRQQGIKVPSEYEIQLLRKDGTLLDVIVSAGIITYNGKPASMAIVKDISERKKAETTLKENEQKLTAILNGSPTAKFVVDKNHTVTYWNKALEELTGITAKEIVGTNHQWKAFYGKERPCLADLLINESLEKIPELYPGKYTKLKLLEESYEATDFFPDIGKNGKWLRFTAALIRNLDGDVIGAEETLEDITEHREMEDKIIEDKTKDEAILDSIGDAVFACDKDGTILLFNNMAEKLSGIPAQEAFGHHYSQILKFIKEAEDAPSDDFIAKAIKEDKITKMANHTMLLRHDGRKIPVADSAAPIKNVKGDIIGCVVVFHDVTHEREVDRAKTEFVSLASHQLRTPLSAVNWYVELLLSDASGTLNSKQKQYAQEALHSSRRMVGLVNALLNVSRLEMGTFAVEPESVDMVHIVKICVEELRQQILEKQIVLQESYSPDISHIQADPRLLSMIFQNLLSNAVKYTPVKGTVRLIIEKENDDILIKVSDTGIGIPDYQKDKIFEKLFRADNTHKIDPDGTGLGLYIVNEILKATGGKIWFESIESKGTTFFVTIPKRGMVRKGGVKQLI